MSDDQCLGRAFALGEFPGIYCNVCSRSEFHWPREFAERHQLDMLTPLLLIERRLKCTTCKVRKVTLREESYSIERDKLGRY